MQFGGVMRSCWFLMVLVACGDDGGGSPDAMPDVAAIPGDFSCAGLSLPTTASDPVLVRGAAIDLQEAGIGGVAVEVHDVANDALLGTATSSTMNDTLGAFGINIATGGAALRTYRKLAATGFVSTYGYDPRPMTSSSPLIASLVLDAATIDGFYQAASVTRDPAKGTVWIDISDCKPDYVAGATVEVSSGTVFYLDDALAIDTTLTATKSGAVLILNANLGEMDAVVHAGPITYVSWPIMVRADSLTQVDRFP